MLPLNEATSPLMYPFLGVPFDCITRVAIVIPLHIMLIKCKLLECYNYNNNMPNHCEKHKKYNNVVFILIRGGLIFKIQLEKGSKGEQKNDNKRKCMKAYEGLKPFGWTFLVSMALQIISWPSKIQYFTNNSRPNNHYKMFYH